MALRIGRRGSGGVSIMSHPVNDEILENLYEEVKEEFPNALEPFVLAEVYKRFEEMST